MKIEKDVWTIMKLVIISAITLPFIINFGYWFVLNFIPGTMFVNDMDVWVGFYGGFLGASVTLIGVYWQISQDKKNKNSDMINDSYFVYHLISDNLSLALTIIKQIDKDINMILELEKLIDEGTKEYNETIEKDLSSLNDEDIIVVTDEDMLMISRTKEKIKKRFKELTNLINFEEEEMIYKSINNSLAQEKIKLLLWNRMYKIIFASIEKSNVTFNFEDKTTIKEFKSLKRMLEKQHKGIKGEKAKFKKIHKKHLNFKLEPTSIN